MTTAEKTEQPRAKAPTPISRNAWQKLGIHTVTLPSGAVVKIRIPDLTLLLAGNAVPENLRQVALEAVQAALGEELGEKPPPLDQARLGQLADMHRFLVSQMLVDPAFTQEELESAGIPSEDMLMLTQLASRQLSQDARGVHLGVEPISRWDIWRQAHECPEECEGCAQVIGEFSSILTG